MDKCAGQIIDLVKQMENVADDEAEEQELDGIEKDTACSEDGTEYEDDNEEDNVKTKFSNKRSVIFSKLHTLLHYSALTRRFGPLVLFSSLKYERKHVCFKRISDVMFNFKNPTLTFAKIHQKNLVLELEESNFIETDFFSKDEFDITRLKSDLKGRKVELQSDQRPHRLKKQILRKFYSKANSRIEYWICADSFWLSSQEGVRSIYAKGAIYELRNCDKKKFPAVLTPKFKDLYVNMDHIFYKNDFLSVKTDGRTVVHYLHRAIM